MVPACLDMLEESLVKKIEVMKNIEEENEKQKTLLKNPNEVDVEAFDKILDDKGELIDRLLKLDDGFQSLFDRVKDEVGDNKEKYKDQIKRMQEYIQEITGMSASIEAAEHRNKKLAEEYFSSAREKMNFSRQTSAAAFNYYQTMNNYRDVPPQFMDNKN
ncbi:FlgN protein [Butyrivibrio proteoclasticus]|uniref:FlgN protein n=2 Tax=Butyrivibrio proteoclasticus TaxID=43305 RepID=A0A1I5Y6D3_9FIRM|nr:FlgN protein [Butyrivibrio proteoclasticus]